MSLCNRCNKPITWKQTKQGKWRTYDFDGGLHYLTCGKSDAELEELKEIKRIAGKSRAEMERGFRRGIG